MRLVVTEDFLRKIANVVDSAEATIMPDRDGSPAYLVKAKPLKSLREDLIAIIKSLPDGSLPMGSKSVHSDYDWPVVFTKKFNDGIRKMMRDSCDHEVSRALREIPEEQR